MVRTALLSALTAAGLILPTPAAEAAPPVIVYPSVAPVYYPPALIVQNWTVRYRSYGVGQWHLYGRFANPYTADLVAHTLQCRGFEVVIGTHG